MNDDIPTSTEIPHTLEADAHGQAALLLVESLIHGLIEAQVLSVVEAIEIVDVATEVKIERGRGHSELPPNLQSSIGLLQNISASLRFDVAGPLKEGTQT
jgi:hypothetical protein